MEDTEQSYTANVPIYATYMNGELRLLVGPDRLKISVPKDLMLNAPAYIQAIFRIQEQLEGGMILLPNEKPENIRRYTRYLSHGQVYGDFGELHELIDFYIWADSKHDKRLTDKIMDHIQDMSARAKSAEWKVLLEKKLIEKVCNAVQTTSQGLAKFLIHLKVFTYSQAWKTEHKIVGMTIKKLADEDPAEMLSFPRDIATAVFRRYEEALNENNNLGSREPCDPRHEREVRRYHFRLGNICRFHCHGKNYCCACEKYGCDAETVSSSQREQKSICGKATTIGGSE